ncbi:MAG: DUF2510 domain-containing protein [Sporichthyaceae bacterium]
MTEYTGPGSASAPGQQPPPPGPAGWYPDPWGQAQQRWFDGSAWTPTTAPEAVPTAVPTAVPGGAWGAPTGAPPAGGWGGPPAAPKKRRIGLIIACSLAALLVVLGVLGTVAYQVFKDDAAFAEVGDCIYMTGVGTPQIDAKKVGCDTPNAINKVALRIERASAACPNENYDFYSEDTVGDFTLCMTLNAKAGECFLGTETSTSRVACERRRESEGFVFKVDRVLGVNRPAQCKETNPLSEGVGYPVPPTTLCVIGLEPR